MSRAPTWTQARDARARARWTERSEGTRPQSGYHGLSAREKFSPHLEDNPVRANLTRRSGRRTVEPPAMPRSMVLCAGFGTRLRPLTDERPKALVPFGDRTLLEHALSTLPDSLLPALVNTHHLADIFVAITADYERVAKVLVEPDIRGTAGGVAAARPELGPSPVLVTNADVLAPVDALGLLAATPGAGLCLAVAPRTRGEGTVGIGEQ